MFFALSNSFTGESDAHASMRINQCLSITILKLLRSCFFDKTNLYVPTFAAREEKELRKPTKPKKRTRVQLSDFARKGSLRLANRALGRLARTCPDLVRIGKNGKIILLERSTSLPTQAGIPRPIQGSVPDYYDRTARIMRENAGHGPSCPYCRRPKTPTDDHGNFSCMEPDCPGNAGKDFGEILAGDHYSRW